MQESELQDSVGAEEVIKKVLSGIKVGSRSFVTRDAVRTLAILGAKVAGPVACMNMVTELEKLHLAHNSKLSSNSIGGCRSEVWGLLTHGEPKA